MTETANISHRFDRAVYAAFQLWCDEQGVAVSVALEDYMTSKTGVASTRTRLSQPLSIGCRSCEVEPGAMCINKYTGNQVKRVHPERVKDAQAALVAAQRKDARYPRAAAGFGVLVSTTLGEAEGKASH